MISQETIDELLERASIMDFSQQLQGVKQHGGRLFAICPFHHEKTGSFHVRDGGKFYHCFGCGASGNVFGFVMKVLGISFPEAVEFIAQKYGVTVIRTQVKKGNSDENRTRDKLKKINKLALHFFLLQGEQQAILHPYLEKRGINVESRKLFQLGYAPNEWSLLTNFLREKGAPEDLMLMSGLVKRNSRGELYDALRGRAVFPIEGIDRTLIGFGGRILPEFDGDGVPKYLNSPETPLYRKSRVLYGLPHALSTARYKREIFVAEGYFDVISLFQNGVQEVVATCGTALTEGHIDILKRSVNKVSVIFDGDTAGRDAASKAFPGFLNSGIEAEAIFLPDGEDPDSFAHSHKSGVAEALKKVPRISLFECFIDFQCRKVGAQERSILSPRQKAQVAQEVGTTLVNTKNPIELDEYLKKTAYVLKTETSLIKELISGESSKNSQKLQRASTSEHQDTQPSEDLGLIPQQLSHPHKLLLRAVMVLKEEALQHLDEIPDIYGNLPKELILFCESFRTILQQQVESEEMQRRYIKDYLVGYGSHWLDFWRESYRIAKEPEVDCFKMLSESILRLREEKVLSSIEVLDASLREPDGESRREHLLQARLDLIRKLRALKEEAAAKGF
jgi:DNA primase